MSNGPSPICTSDVEVQISTSGTWPGTDISEWARRVAPGERTKENLVYSTFRGPKSCAGAAEPIEIEVEALYTEGDTDPFAILREAHYGSGTIGVRWRADASLKWFTADSASVLVWTDPEMAADADEPLGFAATITADTVTWGEAGAAAVPPTGVVAGIPGTWEPVNATVPGNLTALQALGALGETTAWTVGQYVALGDSSHAYWDGDSWAGPGEAP